MLKIAVITRYFPSSAEPWQGRSAYQTLRVLSKEANVRVFFPNANYLPGFRPRTRLYEELDLAYKPKDVDVSYYNFPALPLVSRPINGWMASRVLLPEVRKFGPDLILSFFLYPDGFAGLRIAKTLSVPLVAVSIGSDINNIRDAASARHTRTVLREADFIVTKSHDLRAKAIEMGTSPEKSRAILNGCDLSVFYPSDRSAARRKLGIDEGCEAIVYIGRIDKKKGLIELVQAASLLHAKHPNAQVYMVGEGPDRPAVEHAIKSKHAESYVHAMPSCAPEEVAAWIAAAECGRDHRDGVKEEPEGRFVGGAVAEAAVEPASSDEQRGEVDEDGESGDDGEADGAATICEHGVEYVQFECDSEDRGVHDDEQTCGRCFLGEPDRTAEENDAATREGECDRGFRRG